MAAGLSEHRTGGFPAHQAARCNSRSRPRSGARCTAQRTRAHFDRAPWTGGLNFEVSFDYIHDGVMRSYEQALQRLALDTVDALVIHDLDEMFHQADVLARHQQRPS